MTLAHASEQQPDRRYTDAQRVSQRQRAAARYRALARLAREYPDRYAQLYAEEREASS